MIEIPSQTVLRQWLDYSPETGELRRKFCFGPRAIKGSLVGRRVRIQGVQYKTADVIWKWMTGNRPLDLVDHRDGDIDNTKWSNLREATYQQNTANRVSGKKVGLKGVCLKNGKWLASIRVDGRVKLIGRYDTESEAGLAYATEAEKMYGEFALHRRTVT